MINTAKIMPVDSPTVTGRIYPREVIEKAIENVRTVWGITRLSSDPVDYFDGRTDLARVTHEFKNFRIEDGWLVGDWVPVRSPVSHILSCVEEKTPVFSCVVEVNDKYVSNIDTFAVNFTIEVGDDRSS